MSGALKPLGEVREVIAPGRGQTEAARALGGARRRAGLFPYQWLYPGPNSRHVRRSGNVEITGDGAYPDIVAMQVPEGFRFSLRSVVFMCDNPSWTQGSGNVLFSLIVTGVGSREVEDLVNVDTSLGNQTTPWPIFGRLEFQSLDMLSLNAVVATIGGDGGRLFGQLLGHLYPNAEAGEG